MAWTGQQGLAVTLNIHPSIAGNDPDFQVSIPELGTLCTKACASPVPCYLAASAQRSDRLP